MQDLNKAGIYKLTSPSGKVYIGQSTNIKGRISFYKGEHCILQRHLYNAIKKHGWDNFTIEILWSTNTPEKARDIHKVLDALEIAYIKFYNSIENGYNLMTGGSNGGHSKETREKMSLLKHKAVNQYDRQGNFIRTWDSMKEAAEGIGMKSPSGISDACRGRQKSSGGFLWEYSII